jgi:hypothetical protein
VSAGRGRRSGPAFTLGTILRPLWNNQVTMGGSPAGATVFIRTMEQLGFFSALGLVIVFIAGAACGRILSVTSGIRTVEPVPPAERVATDTVPIETVPIETVPIETVPAETVPAETAPAETLPRRPVRTEDTQVVG